MKRRKKDRSGNACGNNEITKNLSLECEKCREREKNVFKVLGYDMFTINRGK